jgi:DNA-binding LacI/PurR family transcriptional regulator
MPDSVRSTSTDVARRAAVSRATVSYVLNGRTDQSIPDRTRQRVLDAAAELGYVPHAASRALRAGKSRLVLLINSGVPWSTNITDAEDGLTAAVAATGRSLVVWRRQGPDELQVTLANFDPCVAITLDPVTPAEERLLARLHIPLVTAELGTADAGTSTTVQAEHLAAHGHRNLGYLTTSEPVLQRFAVPRTAGFRATCRALGLPEPLVAALPGASAPTVAEVATVLARWRALPTPITAVACFNDLHAAACLAAAASIGLAVPGEFAVIGLDDDDFAPLTTPALTTIRLQPLAFAERLWALARHLLGEGPAPTPFTPQSHLVERDSVHPRPRPSITGSAT